uniref:Uncharacterized protein n=1 Tax=mine drainage metagenome TaxID=410659 RepID=E6PT27_9ZZZZ
MKEFWMLIQGDRIHNAARRNSVDMMEAPQASKVRDPCASRNRCEAGPSASRCMTMCQMSDLCLIKDMILRMRPD